MTATPATACAPKTIIADQKSAEATSAEASDAMLRIGEFDADFRGVNSGIAASPVCPPKGSVMTHS